MKIGGEYRIAAARDAVWQAINDPDILRQCIPGCEEMVQETPTDWTATVVAKVGPVKARFAGKIRLEELMPPASLRLVGEGSGGAAGFAKGSADVTLEEDGGATVLRYDADAEIGGKLAQIGARLIDGFARKYADDFFARFAEMVGHAPAEGSSHGNGAIRNPDMPLPLPAAPTESSGAAQPLDPAPSLTGSVAGATAALAMNSDIRRPPSPAAAPRSDRASQSHPSGGRVPIDPQFLTILVLAALLVFMTVMFAIKP